MNEINYLNFYSKSDLEHFSEEFEQKRLSNDKMILYGEFRDSVLSYKNFNKVNTLEILEKLRKDLRDRQHIIVDLDTPISEREYYYQINEILREHNRLKNENDPEISKDI